MQSTYSRIQHRATAYFRTESGAQKHAAMLTRLLPGVEITSVEYRIDRAMSGWSICCTYRGANAVLKNRAELEGYVARKKDMR